MAKGAVVNQGNSEVDSELDSRPFSGHSWRRYLRGQCPLYRNSSPESVIRPLGVHPVMPFQEAGRCLVGTARLGDDTVHVLDLRLGAAEGAQLQGVSSATKDRG